MVLRPAAAARAARAVFKVSIARRRLVVLRLWLHVQELPWTRRVSIARRRLVVLRLAITAMTKGKPKEVSIARRRLVVLRLPFLRPTEKDWEEFQSPEGD